MNLPPGLSQRVPAVPQQEIAVSQNPGRVLSSGDCSPIAQTLKPILNDIGGQEAAGGGECRSHLHRRQIIDRRLQDIHDGDVVSRLGCVQVRKSDARVIRRVILHSGVIGLMVTVVPSRYIGADTITLRNGCDVVGRTGPFPSLMVRIRQSALPDSPGMQRVDVLACGHAVRMRLERVALACASAPGTAWAYLSRVVDTRR